MEFWTSFAGQMVLRGAATSVTESYDRFVDSAVNAERLGFDGVVASEHHFEYNRFLPSPLQALAAAAAATSRIRLITGALLLPLYDPIRAAEMACAVDVLSGGRLVLGLGQGYRPMEFDGLALAKKTRGARHSEAIDILRLATTHGCVTYTGQHYQYDNVVVRPTPVQRPIELWFCGGNSPAGAQRAARAGVDYWAANLPLAAAKALMDKYRDYAREAGQRPERLRVSMFRDVFIGETVAEAEAARQVYLDVYYNEHIRSYGYLLDDAGAPLYEPPFDHPAYLQFVDSLFCGTYASVIEELKKYEELGVHSITVPPIQIEAFSTHILPAFRRRSH
jgi:alkanesulfonate monooxygenase SsuD/methylene tetrahydromethanopterin reductase-like flavin-dependent oxidoreductase (luciferase family)